MTGTIVALAGSTRTGTIRSREGARLAFSAASVLGEFDTLAVGHLVSYDLDRAPSHHTAVRVFREPLSSHGPGKTPDASPDLRYTGFLQVESVRNYSFDAAAPGYQPQHFIVRVDMALLRKHHIAFQEVPVLCLRKLSADLSAIPDSARHELGDEDLFAYASSRAAAVERKRAKRSFGGHRGPPPPSPSSRVRAS